MVGTPDASEVIHRLADSTEVVSGYLTEQVLARPAARPTATSCSTPAWSTRLSPELAVALTERSGGQLDLEKTADRIGFLRRTAGSDPHAIASIRCSPSCSAPNSRTPIPSASVASTAEPPGGTRSAVCPSSPCGTPRSAEDWDRAARLLALNALSLVLRGRMAELIKLLGGFPQDVAAEDPRLALVQAIPATSRQRPRAREDAARSGASRLTSR